MNIVLEKGVAYLFDGSGFTKLSDVTEEEGGPGGASSFTDLTDAPATITPYGVVCGNAEGDALVMREAISIDPLTGTIEITENGDGGVIVSAAGNGGVTLVSEGVGAAGVFLRGGNPNRRIELTDSSLMLDAGLDEPLLILNLPTSDPAEANQLWNDAGTLKISAG